MSLNKFHITVIAGWIVAVAATFAGSVALGVPTTLAQGIGWLLAGVVPALILMSVFRGAPPPTISEVLYETEHPARATVRAAAATTSGDDAPRI